MLVFQQFRLCCSHFELDWHNIHFPQAGYLSEHILHTQDHPRLLHFYQHEFQMKWPGISLGLVWDQDENDIILCMEILTVSPSRFSTFDWIANTIPRPEIVFWTAAVAALRWHLPSVEFSHFWVVALVDEENNDNDRTSFILFAILLCVGLMHKKTK